MARVVSTMSMSLDGFVTGPDDSRRLPLGRGGKPLHHWVFSEDQGDREILAELLDTVGAIVMGRRSYDFCVGDGGWGDGGPAGKTPCFVLTHRDADPAAPPVFTFVTDGIGSAVEQAKQAAGDKNASLHGASALQQCLRAGLVDEIQVHLIPILLGGGVRLFDNLGGTPFELARDRVVTTPNATHLRYHVRYPDHPAR
jgi:dihydrofolate reductase